MIIERRDMKRTLHIDYVGDIDAEDKDSMSIGYAVKRYFQDMLPQIRAKQAQAVEECKASYLPKGDRDGTSGKI